MHVAIIGSISRSYYPNTWLTKEFNITGTTNDFIHFRQNGYVSFLKNYYGFTIVTATREEREKVEKTEEYKEMERWPHKNSVMVINNILVIKL